MANKMRILVVGLGSIGQRHARLLSERDNVELSICDTVEKHRSDTIVALAGAGANEYADYSEALLDNPDIVFICVPNHLHLPIAKDAIKKGVNVFVEKPVADTFEAARELVAAADSAGVFLQVGYMLRLDDGLVILKNLVSKGAVGNLVGGRAMMGTYITLLNARSNYRDYQPNSLITDYTHELDFIRWIFGEVEVVTAMSATLGDMELKPKPNVFQLILKIRSGALVQVHLDYIQFPQRRIFEIYGDRGTLSYDFMSGEIRHYDFQREQKWKEIRVSPLSERWDDLFRAEHNDLIRRLSGGLSPLVSGEEGVKALEIAELAINAVI